MHLQVADLPTRTLDLLRSIGTLNTSMDDLSDAVLVRPNAEEWANRYLRPLVSGRIYLNVLDFGCGAGDLANAAIEAAPTLQVKGVDFTAERLAAAVPHERFTFAVSDPCSLAFADDTFDIVYGRFVMEHLPEKEKAISEMTRVLKPGGTLLMQELEGQLVWHYPLDAETEVVITHAVNLLKKLGFDPLVGRKLFHMFNLAGLGEINVDIQPYDNIVGSIREAERKQWELKLERLLDPLRQMISDAFADRALKRFFHHLDSPHTSTYSNLFTVTGTKSQGLIPLLNKGAT